MSSPSDALTAIVHPEMSAYVNRLGGDDDPLIGRLEDYALHLALPRVRPGGLILADNVLWDGKTARPATDPDTAALQRFNEAIFAEPCLMTTILAVGNGPSVSQVRGSAAVE